MKSILLITLLFLTSAAYTQSNMSTRIALIDKTTKDNQQTSIKSNFSDTKDILSELSSNCAENPNILFYNDKGSDKHNIEIVEGCREQMEAQLINMKGKIVFSAIFFLPKIQFDLSNLPNEEYYLRIMTSSGTFTKSVRINN